MSTKILGIDIGSFQVRAIIAEHSEDGLKIIGIGTEKAQGVKRGAISNMELASQSIKNALTNAQRVAGTRYDKVIVSISGANTKSLKSSGVVNVPNHEIGLNEIKRVVEEADHYASVPSDYEKIHILPYNFKVDEQENIEDPLGMNGNRLEVQTHIIIAQKSLLSNLRRTVNSAGINIDNIVLSGYASAIATLNNDERELGVALIDIGGSISDVVIHFENSIIFNDFLPTGSAHITSDLSEALHTPLSKAEEIKINYSSISSKPSEMVEFPMMGDENKIGVISHEIVSKVIYARAQETLRMLADIVKNSKEDSKTANLIGAGVVFTGGMTKLDGFKELASMIFSDYQIRIAKPKALEGLYEVIRDPSNSCAIGLCMYGAGEFTPYEIDSEKNIRYKGETKTKAKTSFKNLFEEDSLENKKDSFSSLKNVDEKINASQEDSNTIKNDLLDISDIKQEKEPNFLVKFWQKLTNMF